MTRNVLYGSSGVGFIDGEFFPFAELRIPVTDMGFQLSDMCYDAVHVWNGSFFRLEDHMDRWQRALAERRYESFPYDREEVKEILHGCVARAGLQKAMVMFVATRGSPASGQKDLRTCRNRLIVWAAPYYAAVPEKDLERGCDIVVAKAVRIPPEAVDPTVKNFGRLDFVYAMLEAYDRGACSAVLLDRDGYLTEGRGWNIFALVDGALLSPDRGVLEGITRRTVLELAARMGVPARLARISVPELRRAEEVFLSSTAGGLMPVKRIDGREVGTGVPGPLTQRLKTLYWALHEDSAYMTPVRYELAAA